MSSSALLCSMRLPTRCSMSSFSSVLRARTFHSSLPTLRNTPILGNLPEVNATTTEELEDFNTHEEAEDGSFVQKPEDISAMGHMILRRQRQQLYYLRLIEHEMPKLVAYRKPFIPPTPFTPLIVRSIDYAGEEHPATVKRSIVVPVAHLPLKGPTSVHKLKLLAGVRWSLEPPKGSGFAGDDASREHGFVRISCEDFPKPAMNLKWASDALDGLVTEANNPKDGFKKVPLDMRHIDARIRKAKKGDHARGRQHGKPSLKDFPKEWLPEPRENPELTI